MKEECRDCKYLLYTNCSHPDFQYCNHGELWCPIEGCKYCNEYKDLPEHYINGEFVGKVFDTSIDKYENGWHITLPSGADIGIKYCPFCGRELT